jgi:expansin (peptidoglycan-binding protein)
MRWSMAIAIAATACTGPEQDPEVDSDPIPPEPLREPCPPQPPISVGTATHYLVEDAGKCGLGVPVDRHVAALSLADYAAGAMCGACILVTGPLGQVVVRVIDECPACKRGDVDLGRGVFPLIAPLEAGRVPISWRIVACPVDGKLAYKFKDGTNASWLGVQVRDHRYPLESVEARDSSGRAAYKRLVRTDFNYFIGVNLGAGPLSLRVTDTLGHVVEEPAIALADPATVRPGTQQLAPCPN